MNKPTTLRDKIIKLMDKHANEEYLNSEENYDYKTSNNYKKMISLFDSTLHELLGEKKIEYDMDTPEELDGYNKCIDEILAKWERIKG